MSVAAVLLALTSGCVERKLVITSEPAGADVWVNEQWHGKTPYELPFKHYGTFGIRLEKEGYYPMYVKEPVVAPFYQQPGPDLIAEAVVPKTINDQRNLHYVLQKIGAADDPNEVLGRADEMIKTSEPIIDRRRKYDLMRTPTNLPLPQSDPKKSRALAEEQTKRAIEELTPPVPQTAQPLEKVEPLAPIK